METLWQTKGNLTASLLVAVVATIVLPVASPELHRALAIAATELVRLAFHRS